MIPFIDLPSQYAEIANDVENDILQIMKHCNFINGYYLERFERNVGNYLSASNVIGVSSGSDAIILVLQSLDIGKGDWVILPNNVPVSKATAISKTGAKPLLLDIDPYTYLLNPEQVEEVLKNKRRRSIKAILLVDLYGQMANMEYYQELADKYKVYLIEDASQAMGATYNNKLAGYYSYVAVASLDPDMNLWGIGQGGIIITNNNSLARNVKGIIDQENYLDSLMAAHLYHTLAKLDDWNKRRRTIARYYNECFTNEQRPTQQPSSKHVYNLYVFCCKSELHRNHMEKVFTDRRINYGFHYPSLITDHIQYMENCLETPIAADLKNRLISLPLHPNMTKDQVIEIVEAVHLC